MSKMKPQPATLSIWRITAALAMAVPAFVNALLTRGSVWIGVTAVWVTAFLTLYLVYLPTKYDNLGFSLETDKLILYSGVLYTSEKAIPLRNIQFITIRRNPLEAMFGLCSLEVTAAGGKLKLPGLRPRDAETLELALSGKSS